MIRPLAEHLVSDRDVPAPCVPNIPTLHSAKVSYERLLIASITVAGATGSAVLARL